MAVFIFVNINYLSCASRGRVKYTIDSLVLLMYSVRQPGFLLDSGHKLRHGHKLTSLQSHTEGFSFACEEILML